MAASFSDHTPVVQRDGHSLSRIPEGFRWGVSCELITMTGAGAEKGTWVRGEQVSASARRELEEGDQEACGVWSGLRRVAEEPEERGERSEKEGGAE